MKEQKRELELDTFTLLNPDFHVNEDLFDEHVIVENNEIRIQFEDLSS
ncbi:hypothetical protein QGM71_09220 [Virgibacillus sp. C22-A2]|uniref:Uncharacterized protein n=1 Tax=Virgibacillus tibetensis TaxID=3042313 RepID=A0ABU6KEZ8_9BACI|nr:hypothetical protein [Virgibacillus sp. C22-A2]